ncbi:helix-turn-helix domain-containing protein [Mesorhizobium sp. 1M-11]|uniref:helix-turn-helix domain-containing protein n=1 Tax=Mesorhizobium sp. 1M-11 TaxID=1529006 RepID=UPI0006C76F5D|nr:helix-turn-helix domain-containing protein [Mesorhizobium sp. 1M-11]
MSDLCPCCRQPLPVNDALILDEGGIVVCNGRVAALTWQEHALLEILVAAKHQVRSREQLLDRIYSLRPNDPPEIKIIDVFICHIRRKLKPLGVQIQNVWGRGYRLLPAEERKPA